MSEVGEDLAVLFTVAFAVFLATLLLFDHMAGPNVIADRHCKASGHQGASFKNGRIVCWDVAVTEAK